jgi:hypothetical protein
MYLREGVETTRRCKRRRTIWSVSDGETFSSTLGLVLGPGGGLGKWTNVLLLGWRRRNFGAPVICGLGPVTVGFRNELPDCCCCAKGLLEVIRRVAGRRGCDIFNWWAILGDCFVWEVEQSRVFAAFLCEQMIFVNLNMKLHGFTWLWLNVVD